MIATRIKEGYTRESGDVVLLKYSPRKYGVRVEYNYFGEEETKVFTSRKEADRYFAFILA